MVCIESGDKGSKSDKTAIIVGVCIALGIGIVFIGVLILIRVLCKKTRREFISEYMTYTAS